MTLFTPLTLPNGAVIPNRLAKAAMEENMADADHAPSEALIRLYKAWADGGVGLILTGNVMIDRRAMTGPGGVVLEDDKHLDRFKRWAAAARAGGTQVWMQINHPGRQMPAALNQPTIAPSAVALDLGAYSNRFAVPRAMTADDIGEVKRRFVRTAQLAEQANFTGVQIHAAHGYLFHQFLSPIYNTRSDQWGGSLENRMRFLMETLRAVRKAVGPDFVVGMRVSASQAPNGLKEREVQQVIQAVEKEGLIEARFSDGPRRARQQARFGRVRI